MEIIWQRGRLKICIHADNDQRYGYNEIRHDEYLKFLCEVFSKIEILRRQMLKKKASDEKKEGGSVPF